MPASRGAEEARNELPSLLRAAERGRSTLITRRGRSVAALVPIDMALELQRPQLSLLSVEGTGHGLWGRDSSRTMRRLRDEWSR